MSIKANIKTTGEILQHSLVVPAYQRAYRWDIKNVLQLLNDIQNSMEDGKTEYRIGTCIFFCKRLDDEECNKEIIDGQQRLTTIILFLKCSKYPDPDFFQKYISMNSIMYQENSEFAIRRNYRFIKEWIATNTNDDGFSFTQYLLNNCKFSEIIVDDLSEAFQMFDTQNGRGKSLELYNLLKAYHIRAMEQNTQEEKIRCDRNWEAAIQYDATPDIQTDPNVDILKQLFSEQLFKSRLWCRNETAKPFSRDDIGEFKGITVDKNHSIVYPFQNPYLLQYLTEKFYNSVLSGTIGTKTRFDSGEPDNIDPFVNINHPIINGKPFFDYIETYVEIYKRMFIELGTYQLAEFKEFFYMYCLAYDNDKDKWNKARTKTDAFNGACSKAKRVGDKYLRETYKSICFVLFDKFGERILLKYYKPLYRLVYKNRLQYTAVKQSMVLQMPTSLFAIISKAKDPLDLMKLDTLANAIENSFDHEDKLPQSLTSFIKGERQ